MRNSNQVVSAVDIAFATTLPFVLQREGGAKLRTAEHGAAIQALKTGAVSYHQAAALCAYWCIGLILKRLLLMLYKRRERSTLSFPSVRDFW